jgi:nucleotide-binding universal stress UspA family protein
MNTAPAFLVAVDFSEGSNKAVEYAVMLAQMLRGKVTLIHVADPSEITESHNQIVVLRAIHRTLDKGKARLLAYREMIVEKWGVSVAHIITIGHLEDILPVEIGKVRPDIVFLGKNGKKGRKLKAILQQVQAPVIVVPASATVNKPRQLVLATDLLPVQPEVVKPLLKLSDSNSHILRLLHISNPNGRNGIHPEKITSRFTQQLKVTTEFLHHKDRDTVAGVQEYLEASGTDLICTVRRQRGFFRSLFVESTSVRLALAAVVPTLIVTEKTG